MNWSRSIFFASSITLLLFTNLGQTAAADCQIKVLKLEQKLVQAQIDTNPEKLDEFAEINVTVVSPGNVSGSYQSSLPGETGANETQISFAAGKSSTLLKLSRDWADVFVESGKRMGAAGQVSLLRINVHPVDSQSTCDIFVSDSVASPPLDLESRMVLHSPYTAELFWQLAPLERKYKSAASLEKKNQIARKALHLMFAAPTQKLQTLIKRAGITAREALEYAAHKEEDSVTRFPSFWRWMGPDYLAYMVSMGMMRNPKGHSSLSPTDLHEIVWSSEKHQSVIRLTTTNGTEAFNFSDN